jgi:hypothetical protein
LLHEAEDDAPKQNEIKFHKQSVSAIENVIGNMLKNRMSQGWHKNERNETNGGEKMLRVGGMEEVEAVSWVSRAKAVDRCLVDL